MLLRRSMLFATLAASAPKALGQTAELVNLPPSERVRAILADEIDIGRWSVGMVASDSKWPLRGMGFALA